MKNWLIFLLVRLLKPWIKVHKNTGRILVVSTTALGDTLWGTAAVASLRKSFPEKYIALLTSKIGAQVFKSNPHVNQIYVYPDDWRKLYQERFDQIVVLHVSQRMVIPLIAFLGAWQMVGSEGMHKGLDWLFTDLLPQKKEHEIARRLRLVERLGAKSLVHELQFFVPETAKSDRKQIFIHPGSKDRFKRWPASFFIGLGCRLQKEGDIVITGTMQELELMKQVSDGIPGSQVLDPTLSLHDFGARLKNASLLICNDTGPFHLACAIEVPVVGIYVSTDPLLCGPYLAKNARIVQKQPTCYPCLKKRCASSFCFLQVSVEEVLSAALGVL